MNRSHDPVAWLPAVSPAAPGALYEQIIEGLKREISEGRLPAGSPLPSFRKLAEDLLVSVITVKRAYEELERAGIIYRRQGLGTFVAENGENRTRQSKLERAQKFLQEGIQEAQQAGLDQKAILKLIHEILFQPRDKKP